ncbi:hypothetical protein [Jannaschia sp. R86511]|uniref:hypothetical protein n=1 Tax=Jannaschia sp. R86511 TaxID=3093853 RepID=UPI0036D28136
MAGTGNGQDHAPADVLLDGHAHADEVDRAHPHPHHVSAHNPHAGQGPVVLDIGGDVGALVLHTPGSLVGTEVEISPAGRDQERRHVEVLPRRLSHRTVFAAVYPDLAAGTWTVWAGDGAAVLSVEVQGGQVQECRWPERPGAPAPAAETD